MFHECLINRSARALLGKAWYLDNAKSDSMIVKVPVSDIDRDLPPSRSDIKTMLWVPPS